MILSEILTSRKINTWTSFHLVYEWEDILSQKMNYQLNYETKLYSKFNSWVKKVSYSGRIPFLAKDRFQLKFEIKAKRKTDTFNRKNVIPVIIDFHLSKDELPKFIKTYKRNPFILISSAEIMEFLDRNNCPLKYFHFPLSLSDIYRFRKEVLNEKKYDLLLAGRQNPVLESYLNRYIQENPNLTYIYRKQEKEGFFYYTNTGELLGEFGDRASYISLLHMSRIGFYSTPGIDGGEIRTKGFSQMTPRFLELIASGCHVIARYKENSDTDFFTISEFPPM